MKQGGTASKPCEKHDHSATLPTVPFIAEFSYFGIFPQAIGIQVSSLHVNLELGSYKDSFRASLSPG